VTKKYFDVYQSWEQSPINFWAEASKNISWFKPWDKVLCSDNAPMYKWFPGGVTNTCYNAVDRHVAQGHGDRSALIYDSAMTGEVATYSYFDMQDRVSVLAGALVEHGVTKGDSVLIYMPMIPESVFAMLACARIGAVHVVVFGGFAPPELAKRIDLAKPKLILTASCGLEPNRVVDYKDLLNQAIDASSQPQTKTFVFQRKQLVAPLIKGRDFDWREVTKGGKPVDCVPVMSNDPLYVLYTSGSTGVPKGIVRDNGGHLVGMAWSMKNVYAMSPGDVFWAASDIGWVVGHSYIVYGPLIHGCTTVLYEGKPVGTPDESAFWRVLEQHKVNALFVAPTAIRAIKKNDPEGTQSQNYDLSEFRNLFLAGERSDNDTVEWAKKVTNVPVIDHWWQTETGWAISSNCMGIEMLPLKRGSLTKPVPGFDLRVFNDEGQELPPGQVGNFLIKLPLPPGAMLTLWENNIEGCIKSYFSDVDGYYSSGDTGYKDEDGYVFILGRVDDIINVAGHRLATGGIEEVLSSHDGIAECAVVGAADSLKGQVPVAFVVLKNNVKKSAATLKKEMIACVRNGLGPVASFKTVYLVNQLPKTKSGKILRDSLRKTIDKIVFDIPSTIEDSSVLDHIKLAIEAQA